MPRDYKSARKRPARSKPVPGWVWMLYGLGVGLAVALWVYMHDRQPDAHSRALDKPTPQVSSKTEPEEEDAPSRRFDFYDMLPRFEVVIPEIETGAPTPRDKPVEKPGSYVLQAGSFKNYADADRMKAQLALLGAEASIQRVTIDDKTWHRVRVGPLKNLDQVNSLRERMREANIDVFVVRLSE
jgi:cell division protein FtsN